MGNLSKSDLIILGLASIIPGIIVAFGAGIIYLGYQIFLIPFYISYSVEYSYKYIKRKINHLMSLFK